MTATATSPALRSPLLGVARWIYALAVLVYVAAVAVGALRTPHGRFTNDSMNYVDVARNLRAGRGIVQSATGFNQPRIVADAPIPAPMTSQPPLYPLLIALGGALGLSEPGAALVVAALGQALVLAAGGVLALALWGEATAALGVAALLGLRPLHVVAGQAWSETLGVGLLLAGFAVVARARSARTIAIGGALLGLAFATRYSLLPALPLGALLVAGVLGERDRGRMARAVFSYAAAAALPVVAVLAHNLASDGTLLGPARNPSTRGFSRNLHGVFVETLGAWLPDRGWANPLGLQEDAQEVLFGVFLVAAMGALRWRGALRETLLLRGRFVLPLSTLVYLAALVAARTRSHFDTMSARLVFPASVTLALVAAALVVAITRIGRGAALALGAGVAVLAASGALQEALASPAAPDGAREAIARSGRLAWVAANTGERDLIVGEDVVDVAFYLRRPELVSFSSYPYTRYLDGAVLRALAVRHCRNYGRVFLLLRNHGSNVAGLESDLGPFLGEVFRGRWVGETGVAPGHALGDGYVFELRCSQ